MPISIDPERVVLYLYHPSCQYTCVKIDIVAIFVRPLQGRLLIVCVRGLPPTAIHVYPLRGNAEASLLLDRRQARGRNGLADAPALFVGQLDVDPLRNLGELGLEHFIRAVQDELPPTPGGATAQDQHVLEFVEIRVVRDAIAHVIPDALPDLARAFVARLEFFLHEFAETLSKADLVIVTDVYAARETPIHGAGAEDIVKLINEQNPAKAAYIQNKDEVAQSLAGQLRSGDVVLIMGAGDVWEVGRELVRLLEAGGR